MEVKNIKVGDTVYVSVIGGIKAGKVSDIYNSSLSVNCGEGNQIMTYRWHTDLTEAVQEFIDGINHIHETNYVLEAR